MSGFLPPDHVNRLLACNFRVMNFLGDRVLRPFLQDTIQWLPLTLAMNGMVLSDPLVIIRVFAQVTHLLLRDLLGTNSDGKSISSLAVLATARVG